MGTTYIAWDGNEYEWPPPKGWYQAIDNRWWAPDTGPVAMGENPQLTDATTLMEQGSEITNPAGVRQAMTAQQELPAWAKPSEALTSSSPFDQTPQVDNFGSAPNRNNAALGLGAGIGFLALLLFFTIWFFGFRGGDSTTTPPTQNPNTQQPNQPNTQEPQPNAKPETFEYQLTVNEISIENFKSDLPEEVSIPDSAIPGQASTICEAVNQAQDTEGYFEVRRNFVTSTITEYRNENTPPEEQLSPIVLESTIELALVNFCPAVAERLSIQLDN